MSYLKFLNLVQAIRELPRFPAMDSAEELLLNALASAWNASQQVSVVEVMNMLPAISPSTVHRRLKTLRQKGLIALQEDGADSRVKYVVGTPLARQYFSKMEECFKKAGE